MNIPIRKRFLLSADQKEKQFPVLKCLIGISITIRKMLKKMRKKRSYNSKISSFEIILFFEWMSKIRPEKSSSFFESSLNKSIDTLQGL